MLFGVNLLYLGKGNEKRNCNRHVYGGLRTQLGPERAGKLEFLYRYYASSDAIEHWFG